MELSNSAVKSTDAEPETQTQIRLPPPPSSNGVLKRHAPPHLHPVLVTYKECLKNHAASLGGHAVDGCGEFMPSPATDPASLKCAACGCHRNFHRREPEEPPWPIAAAPALEYRPHHRHHPPPPIPLPPPHGGSPDSSPSPPPISSSFFPSAPPMLLALSHGLTGAPADIDNTPITAAAGGVNTTSSPVLSSKSRKRFRTKLTHLQKEKMREIAERVGWKIQKKDEDLIDGFCSEIGVERGVLKVWMHNNKCHFVKKDQQSNGPPPPPTNNGGGMSAAAEYSEGKESILPTTNGSCSS